METIVIGFYYFFQSYLFLIKYLLLTRLIGCCYSLSIIINVFYQQHISYFTKLNFYRITD